MNTANYIDFATQWNVALPQTGLWTDLLPLIERVCEAKKGYFIFKVDGERTARKYTFTLNLPFPADVVLRKDADNLEDGLEAIVQGLRESNLSLEE